MSFTGFFSLSIHFVITLLKPWLGFFHKTASSIWIIYVLLTSVETVTYITKMFHIESVEDDSTNHSVKDVFVFSMAYLSCSCFPHLPITRLAASSFY